MSTRVIGHFEASSLFHLRLWGALPTSKWTFQCFQTTSCLVSAVPLIGCWVEIRGLAASPLTVTISSWTLKPPDVPLLRPFNLFVFCHFHWLNPTLLPPVHTSFPSLLSLASPSCSHVDFKCFSFFLNYSPTRFLIIQSLLSHHIFSFLPVLNLASLQLSTQLNSPPPPRARAHPPPKHLSKPLCSICDCADTLCVLSFAGLPLHLHALLPSIPARHCPPVAMLEHMSRRSRSLLSLTLTTLALALSILALCTSYWCEGTHKVVKPLCLSPVKMKNCGQNNSEPYTTGTRLWHYRLPDLLGVSLILVLSIIPLFCLF